MTYETLLVDIANGVATVTLNRPERLNAFNGAMTRDFRKLWSEQISNLLDTHLRCWVGNANTVVVELSQQNLCFKFGHCSLFPCLRILDDSRLWLEEAGLHRHSCSGSFLCGCL